MVKLIRYFSIVIIMMVIAEVCGIAIYMNVKIELRGLY
jgi:hypothetical protein